MNRRNFLANLFKGAAVVAAAPVLAKLAGPEKRFNVNSQCIEELVNGRVTTSLPKIHTFVTTPYYTTRQEWLRMVQGTAADITKPGPGLDIYGDYGNIIWSKPIPRDQINWQQSEDRVRRWGEGTKPEIVELITDARYQKESELLSKLQRAGKHHVEYIQHGPGLAQNGHFHPAFNIIGTKSGRTPAGRPNRASTPASGAMA